MLTKSLHVAANPFYFEEKTMHLQYIAPATIDAIVAQDNTAYRFAVARAVASVLPVPAAPMESAAVYFKDIHFEMAEKILATFNEAKPVNLDEALELTKMFWTVRYATVHDAADDALVEGLVVKPTLFDLVGATAFMTNDQRDYLCENYAAVLSTLGLCIKAARKMHAAYIGA